MKINQIRFSRNVKFFTDRMMQKFSLLPYTDTTIPVVMYGIYNVDDFSFYQTHKPAIIVLWRGTDAKILDKEKARIILSKKNVRHYAGSQIVKQSLTKWGIRAEIKPITSTSLNIQPELKGDCVYCYICSNNPLMSDKYKYNDLKKIAGSLPYNFVFTTQRQYNFKDLTDIYRKCFVGVRLLDHDGMSNSILEMGLMGRRTISNSGLPHTIRWKSITDVIQAINTQYKQRKLDDYKTISRDYRKLIDIGDSWLQI